MKDKALHTWDEGEETTSAGYGAVGEMTYKCTECDATKIEPISALDAKDCSVAFESGYNPGRAYNGTEIVIHKAKIIRKDANGETIVTPEDDIVLEFKVKGDDDSTYSTNAPKNSGTYSVRATVKGSAEWKECSTATALDFTISKVKLTGTVTHPTSQTYTASVQDFPNLKITSADLSCIVAGDTLDLANIKSTVADAGTNKATFSFVETNNYYMQNDGSLTVNVTISPKPIILSGEYSLIKFDASSAMRINFTIPSGLPENVLLKVNLDRSGKAWAVNNQYSIKNDEYKVIVVDKEIKTADGKYVYVENKNYSAQIADDGILLVIKEDGSAPAVSTFGSELSVVSGVDGYFKITTDNELLKTNKSYQIAVTKDGTGTRIADDNITFIAIEQLGHPVTLNIQYLNGEGMFFYNGMSGKGSTIYVKGEANTTYKVKITEIT